MVFASLFTLAALATNPLIIPKPKEAKFSGTDITLSSVSIICGRSKLDRTAAEVISRELVESGARKPTIRRWPPKTGPLIVVGEPDDRVWINTLLGKNAKRVPKNPQGYFLMSQPGSRVIAVVAGKTPEGTLYGAQTLCQMISSDGQNPALKEGQVRDWPSLRWRGVHLFVGNTALPFHKKLISNILSRFKMNRLVLQCEQAKWDSLAGIAPDWAMSKKDLREELRYARKYGVEPVPLVNSFGHMQWLMKGTRYESLAEDPKTPYNICPTDPRTYRLLSALYAEVLRAFNTREMHVGGDEVIYGGRYPYRSRAKHKRLCDLYVAHIVNLQRILHRRGAHPMIWGDLMFAKNEVSTSPANAPSPDQAAFIRANLPTDTTDVDWHYRAGGEDERLAILEASGHKDVIGATWTDYKSIQQYAKALSVRGHRGLLQTTWVGYNSQEKNLKSAGYNFWNFVVAADMAWNGGSVQAEDLKYKPQVVFERAYALPVGARP